MEALIKGSLDCAIMTGSGYLAGLSIIVSDPSLSTSMYWTDGAVRIMEMLNSLSSLSCTISRNVSNPRNPHLNHGPMP